MSQKTTLSELNEIIIEFQKYYKSLKKVKLIGIVLAILCLAFLTLYLRYACSKGLDTLDYFLLGLNSYVFCSHLVHTHSFWQECLKTKNTINLLKQLRIKIKQRIRLEEGVAND